MQKRQLEEQKKELNTIYSTIKQEKEKLSNAVLEANEKERIDKSIWLRKRVHDLFNSKRVAAYILDLINKNEKELIKYEWYK